MFGTRADVVVDLTFAATLLAPLLALVSFRWVRQRRYERHRRMQLAVLAVCVTTVLAFELRLRLDGGSGAFLRGARPDLRTAARALLAAHVIGAVITYVAWAWLAVASSRRRPVLPGAFSRRHRRLGWCVFSGLCFTAVTAAGMYALAFVL